jgi:hypothetical protein
MPEHDNEMRGVLFRNEKKTPGDSRPNAKGRIQINGVVYWLSSWTKTSQKGDKYQQLKAEVAEAKYQPNRQAATPQQATPSAQAPIPQGGAPDPTFGIAPEHDPDDIPF